LVSLLYKDISNIQNIFDHVLRVHT